MERIYEAYQNIGSMKSKPTSTIYSSTLIWAKSQANQKPMQKHPKTLSPQNNIWSLGQMYRIGSFADDAALQRKWSIFDLFAPLLCQDSGFRLRTCTYVYTYMHVCICIYIYIYVDTHTHIYRCICIQIYTSITWRPAYCVFLAQQARLIYP